MPKEGGEREEREKAARRVGGSTSRGKEENVPFNKAEAFL